MAKKVRGRPEATEESKFEFPVFDEAGFIRHELELTYAMFFAIGFAVLAGVLSGLSAVDLPSSLLPIVPLLIGLAVIVATPFVLPLLRSEAGGYTKSDWAGLIAIEFFGWLALWFVIGNLAMPT